MAGVPPGPHNLRQLAAMAKARRIDEWNRAADLMALLVNVHGGHATRADFHPFMQAVRPIADMVKLAERAARGKGK